MKSFTNTIRVAAMAIGLLSARESQAMLEVLQRYDYGSATSPTQAGFTAVTFAQKYDGVNSGFDVGDLSFGAYDRDPSIWSAQASSFITQTNLQRDGIYGRNGPISLRWHDVLPSGASNAVVIVWLGDPTDHNFGLVTASAAHAGITNVIGVWNESIHFVTNLTANIGPLNGSGTLDVILSVDITGDNSNARWSGLEITYTLPEPSATTLLLLACACALVLRRRFAQKSVPVRAVRAVLKPVPIVLVLGAALFSAPNAQALLSIVHQYDFEGDNGTNTFGGGVTEPGWTRITVSSNATATTPGLIAGDTHITFGTAIYRGTSTQDPKFVIFEEFVGSGQGGPPVPGTTEPTIAFRDIVPTNAYDVSFIIYRSDPLDNFHAAFLTTVSVNGGAEILVDSGHGVVDFYHPPITGFLQLTPSTTEYTLDWRFYDNFSPYTGSQVRLNGMYLAYSVPEPSIASLLLLGVIAGFSARNRSARGRT